MEKIKCTAIIHTRNADTFLQEVIDRLQDFDEIMVVDMDSTDHTLDIARRNGCRIMSVEPAGYAEPARDLAMRAASHDWVFFVDADEIIPETLTAYIRNFIENPGDIKGLMVARRNLFLDTWRRADYPDYQLRLFDRRVSYWPKEVHSRPHINGKIDRIPAKHHELAMIHKPPTMEAVMERMNRYTTFEVDRRAKKPVTLSRIIFKPWFRFFKSFILKGGFLHGISGYIAAKNDAIYLFFAMSKVYEHSLSAKPADEPGREKMK